MQNPYCEPELALKILPTLSPLVLRDVARNRTLQAAVRAVAARLCGAAQRADDEGQS